MDTIDLESYSHEEEDEENATDDEEEEEDEDNLQKDIQERLQLQIELQNLDDTNERLQLEMQIQQVVIAAQSLLPIRLLLFHSFLEYQKCFDLFLK